MSANQDVERDNVVSLEERRRPTVSGCNQVASNEPECVELKICCGKYDKCMRACTPRGRREALNAVQDQLEDAQRYRHLREMARARGVLNLDEMMDALIHLKVQQMNAQPNAQED